MKIQNFNWRCFSKIDLWDSLISAIYDQPEPTTDNRQLITDLIKQIIQISSDTNPYTKILIGTILESTHKF